MSACCKHRQRADLASDEYQTFGSSRKETVGDGFQRFGDGNVIGASAVGIDRDGAGVPNDEDLCPDWLGSEQTSGC